MSRRALKTDDEEGFLRAYKDEILDAQESYKVKIEVEIEVRPERPGVTFLGTAYSLNRETGPVAVAHAEVRYPTHSASRLHADLYRLAIALSVALSRDYEAKTGLIHPLAADATRKG